VLSNEDFNRLAGLATVVPLTTARRRPRSWEVLIPAGSAGLPNDSIALVPHLRTISHDRFRLPTYGRLVDPVLRLAIARLVVEHFDFDDLEPLVREP
jgi:mRNA-degrading endonuclease toxin of MazEF toxin-antitoxin module